MELNAMRGTCGINTVAPSGLLYGFTALAPDVILLSPLRGFCMGLLDYIELTPVVILYKSATD